MGPALLAIQGALEGIWRPTPSFYIREGWAGLEPWCPGCPFPGASLSWGVIINRYGIKLTDMGWKRVFKVAAPHKCKTVTQTQWGGLTVPSRRDHPRDSGCCWILVASVWILSIRDFSVSHVITFRWSPSRRLALGLCDSKRSDRIADADIFKVAHFLLWNLSGVFIYLEVIIYPVP